MIMMMKSRGNAEIHDGDGDDVECSGDDGRGFSDYDNYDDDNNGLEKMIKHAHLIFIKQILQLLPEE